MAESSTHHQQEEEKEEEEDYMGDLTKFIPTQQPSKTLKKTHQKPHTKPSIQPPKKLQKPHINRQEQKERKQLQEDQQTLQNLTSSIPDSNVGFKMLKLMGYTPGTGLGRKGGRVDPVGVEIRRSRVGIGGEDPALARLRRERDKQMAAREKALRDEKGVEEMAHEFGVRVRREWRVKRLLGSWRKAKDLLHRFENREVVEDEDEEDEEEEVITEEDLIEILVKLREEHCYCLFCGCQYESAEALLASCPGVTEDDH
ncbi:hypothetical protein vseg_012305 [Gypsophila vaccaria]